MYHQMELLVSVVCPQTNKPSILDYDSSNLFSLLWLGAEPITPSTTLIWANFWSSSTDALFIFHLLRDMVADSMKIGGKIWYPYINLHIFDPMSACPPIYQKSHWHTTWLEWVMLWSMASTVWKNASFSSYLVIFAEINKELVKKWH